MGIGDLRQKFVLQRDVDILLSKLRAVNRILEDVEYGLLGTRDPKQIATAYDDSSIENTVKDSLNEADEIIDRARRLRSAMITEGDDCGDDKPAKVMRK